MGVDHRILMLLKMFLGLVHQTLRRFDAIRSLYGVYSCAPHHVVEIVGTLHGLPPLSVTGAGRVIGAQVTE